MFADKKGVEIEALVWWIVAIVILIIVVVIYVYLRNHDLSLIEAVKNLFNFRS